MNELPIQKPDRGGRAGILIRRLSTALCAISLAMFITACAENPTDSDENGLAAFGGYTTVDEERAFGDPVLGQLANLVSGEYFNDPLLSTPEIVEMNRDKQDKPSGSANFVGENRF